MVSRKSRAEWSNERAVANCAGKLRARRQLHRGYQQRCRARIESRGAGHSFGRSAGHPFATHRWRVPRRDELNTDGKGLEPERDDISMVFEQFSHQWSDGREVSKGACANSGFGYLYSASCQLEWSGE